MVETIDIFLYLTNYSGLKIKCLFMKKYLLSTILAISMTGAVLANSDSVLAKSPSKHDDVVVNVSLPTPPAAQPAAAQPIVINNTATATNNNYPTNTNTIDLDLINSIKDLVKEMSAENCQQAKSKAYPYRTSWSNYGQGSSSEGSNAPVISQGKKYYHNDFSNYEWNWGPYEEDSGQTNYANYDWGSENGTNYKNIDWESEWNKAWDDGWSNGWDTGWDDAFNYIQSDEWTSGQGDTNTGNSTTTEQSTYSI